MESIFEDINLLLYVGCARCPPRSVCQPHWQPVQGAANTWFQTDESGNWKGGEDIWLQHSVSDKKVRMAGEDMGL